MHDFLNRFQNYSLNQPLIIISIFTLIAFLSMRPFLEPLITPEAPSGIISFELAKTLEQSQAMLSSWNTNAKINAGLSFGIDFLFLFFYSFLFALICFSVAKKYKNNIKWFYKLGIYIAFLQFAAAIFDAIENIALIKLLLGSNNDIHSSIAYYFASVKFAIIAIGIIYIVIGLITSIFQKRLVSE
jgi:hypothetical protein